MLSLIKQQTALICDNSRHLSDLLAALTDTGSNKRGKSVQLYGRTTEERLSAFADCFPDSERVVVGVLADAPLKPLPCLQLCLRSFPQDKMEARFVLLGQQKCLLKGF